MMETYVYVIATRFCGEPRVPCKVGFSASPPKRLAALNVASPSDLMLAHIFSLPSKAAAEQVERKFHRDHAGHRLNGEWFRIDPAVIIKTLSGQIRAQMESWNDLEPWQRRAIIVSLAE